MQVQLPQIEQILISSIMNLAYELPHNSSNELRLRIIRNYKKLQKSQVWVEREPSFQPPFQKLNFDYSSKKHAKIDVKFLLLYPILPDFFIFFQMFSPRL